MIMAINIIEIIYSFLAGIVQGITEWLPVSSTGHLILLDSLFNIETLGVDFINMFDVVIQFGSILAIVVIYFQRLNPFAPSKSKGEKKETWTLWSKILVAAVPAGVIGVLFDDLLESTVFAEPQRNFIIAGTLFVYGVAFILIERFLTKNKKFKITSPEDITYKTALGIGAFQILALVPGTSRSGSTIIGSTILGVSRKASAEFSFFLAIPVMFGASLLKIAKFVLDGEAAIGTNEIIVLLIGTVVSFVVSFFVVRFLVDFVRRHSFECFGWYRIALSVLVVLYFALIR